MAKRRAKAPLPSRRSTWKAFLKLSLVSVPVRGYTANKAANDLRLNQLHRGCGERVRYQKVCPEHGVLSSDDIVKGHEFSKGEYVLIDEEELDLLRTENDHSISVEGFIPAGSIEATYHAGKTYYLLPEGNAGEKPYALLRESMVRGDVEGLAHVVISGREQMVLVRPIGTVLALTLLYHHERLHAWEPIVEAVPEAEVSDDELALGAALIAASRIEDLDLTSYEDTYRARMTELIRMKVEGEEIVQTEPVEQPKVLNLMEALKASVAAAEEKASATA